MAIRGDNGETGEPEVYYVGYAAGYVNAPRSEGDEYGGGWWTDEWRRGWEDGLTQWDGRRGLGRQP